MKSIGIQIIDGSAPGERRLRPVRVAVGDYDIADFAGVSPTGDPSGTSRSGAAVATRTTRLLQPQGVDLMEGQNAELDPASGQPDFEGGRQAHGGSVPMFPLYQRPTPLIYKSDLLGMNNNPATIGPPGTSRIGTGSRSSE